MTPLFFYSPNKVPGIWPFYCSAAILSLVFLFFSPISFLFGDSAVICLLRCLTHWKILLYNISPLEILSCLKCILGSFKLAGFIYFLLYRLWSVRWLHYINHFIDTTALGMINFGEREREVGYVSVQSPNLCGMCWGGIKRVAGLISIK